MKNTLSDLLGKQYVAALHARAVDYAFRDYFENTGEYEAARQQAEAETGLNRLVHKSLKVTTPFQLLKWFFGIPRFEIGVSEMLGGLFIFDEIHTYDAHTVALISEMVRVLKRLGGRCLFMSATFPLFMKTLLGDAVGEEPAEFSLDEDQSDDWTRHFLSLARHRLRWHDVPLESLSSQVVRAAQNGKRVLVVANRVAQAQEIYRAIRGEFPDAALLHSRFTRRDRTEEEKRIIGTFRGEYDEELKALVATQVVEVSLDVSFDTIFTEVAPVDDLLQRFGRVNRYGEHPDGVEVHVARRFDNDRLRWVYDLARLQQTLEDAPDDGTPLTVELASEWTRKVYQGGWTEKESKRFDNAKVSFQSVVKSLRPLRRNPEGSDDFRGLFQSVEVLPRALFMEYDEHISNKHYLLAMQLLVPISLGTFHALRNAGGLTFIESGVWIADALYDDELGLIPEDTDTDDNII